MEEVTEPSVMSQQTFDNSSVSDNARAHFGNQYNNYYGPTSQSALTIAALVGRSPAQNLIEVLQFHDMDLRRATIRSAYGNTCQWLFGSLEYNIWRDDSKLANHNGFLWIRGKPGAGKSTLMKAAVRYADEQLNNDLKISFFFNAKGSLLEQSTEGMYRSLLCQLLAQCEQVSKVFNEEAWRQQTWSIELLQEYFKEAILQLGAHILTCHIDALDECDESDMRDMVDFFEDLGSRAVSSGIRLYICFASRHYPLISISKCVHLVLDGLQGHQEDIEAFVQNKLRVPESALRDELAKAIRARARDVFLWVVLVVQLLNRESDRGNGHRLQAHLDAIPGGVHGLFENSILARGTEDNQYLLRTLTWVLYARRPLTPKELYNAVLYANNDPEVRSADVGHEPSFGQIERFLLNASKGLVEVALQHDRAQFIHETVREYLQHGGMGRLESSLCDNPIGSCNDILKESCIAYMSSAARILQPIDSLPGLPDGTSMKTLGRRRWQALDMFPFLHYAWNNYLTHAELAETHDISQVAFVEMFPTETVVTLDGYFRVHNGERYSPSVSKAYIFASSKASKLLRIELSEQCGGNRDQPCAARIASHMGGDVAMPGFHKEYYGSPLQVAAFNDDTDSVRVLLSHGANVNVEGGFWHTALQAATFRESSEIVCLLLEHGADVDARRPRHTTALYHAVMKHNMKIARLLVEYGANVNAESERSGTVLQTAYRYKCLNVDGMVDFLLEHGARQDKP